jgi:cytidyltransferase-like protein
MPKTVYLPGVFDLLHAGHFNIIHRCRSIAGDAGRLAVGVCSDRACESTKRKPAWSQESRLRMVALLEIVDEAFIYHDVDQSETLKSLKPDVFVHGPDYGISEPQKKTLTAAAEAGIEIVELSRTEGVSTTMLLGSKK